MNVPPVQGKYHAVSMQLAGYSDERHIGVHILSDTGKTIAVTDDRDSIFAIQQHIAQIAWDCPEILTWKGVPNKRSHRDSNQDSAHAAVSEGWPVSSRDDILECRSEP
jgi:hypothetical protein